MSSYLFESSICMSVSLLGYFLLFSRGKYFRFNRFYLLLTLLLSLLIPLLNVAIPNASDYLDEAHFNLSEKNLLPADLQNGDAEIFGVPADRRTFFQISPMLTVLYALGVLVFLYRYFKNVLALIQIAAASEKIISRFHTIVLLKGDVGPYSFLHWIFVSETDYRNNRIHEMIWAHELAHVSARHSLDILAIEFLLALFYFNPLLWVYRYLVKLNHEYSADEIVMQTYPDVQQYAYQLIQFSHPKRNMQFECSFNYGFTKKRLMMLTQTKISKVLFGNKVVLAAVLVLSTAALLSFNNVKKIDEVNVDEHQIPIVIDLGHGGNDMGAVSSDGRANELEIINAIGSLLKEQDTESRFLFTRGTESVALADRAKFAAAQNAGLLVSIHISTSENANQSGVEVFYAGSKPSSVKSKQVSEILASLLRFRAGSEATTVKTADFVVLRESKCPAVLLTLGFVSNQRDVEYLSNDQNQSDLAKQIVKILYNLNL